jgi:Zn-dependent peptidase ImmA (M78 family)
MARHLGVSDIRSRRIPADGRLRRENGKLILEVNETAPSSRKRFTIAHEIGHLLLADGGAFGCETMRSRGFASRRDADPREERWCDFIAAEVLIPIEWAADFTYGKAPGFDTIQAMAKHFDTSLAVAARRAVEAGMWRTRLIFWQASGDSYEAVAAYPAYSPTTLAFMRLDNLKDSLVGRALRSGRSQSGREKIEIEGSSEDYDVDVWCEGKDKAAMLLILEPRRKHSKGKPLQPRLFQP